MSTRVDPAGLAAAVIDELDQFAKLTEEELGRAVERTGESVRRDISEHAPRDTGAYARSWTVKKGHAGATTSSVVVHSKSRYRLTHLLEFGHAKRGGGRVAARPHIEPARERGEKTLEELIESEMSHG